VRSLDPLYELVAVVDVEDQDAGPAELEQVADTGGGHVQVAAVRQAVGPGRNREEEGGEECKMGARHDGPVGKVAARSILQAVPPRLPARQ
jgi:hypothetical protein